MSESKWYLRTQDETFGPETEERLVEWARMGRIQPGQEVSDDNVIWRRVEEVPFLDMRFSIDLGDGNPRGPFNKAAADALIASGRLPPTATVVESRPPFEEEPAPVAEPGPAPTPEAEPEPKVVEKIVEVAPPARTVIVDHDAPRAIATPPPAARGGIFKDVDRSRLAALEAAAQRELAAAKQGHLGALAGLFGRKH